MSIKLGGDATGDFIGTSNGNACKIHFNANGGIIIQHSTGQSVQFQDGSGNITAQIYESTRQLHIQSLTLGAGNGGGGAFSFQNPESTPIYITRIEIDVTTPATAAGTLSAGTTTVNGTTSSNNLIDTLDVHTATGLFDNVTDHGTNGKSRQKVPVGKWVTGSMASGSLAGLQGNVYIHYHLA